MSGYNQINWLASYPKSGSTWVRCLLEAYLFGEVDINRLRATVTDDNISWAGDPQFNPMELPLDIRILTRQYILTRLVHFYLKEEYRAPLVVKSHSLVANVSGTEMYPVQLTKSMVCLVRDPRSLAPSFAAHLGVDLDHTIEILGTDKMAIQNEEKGRLPNVLASWSLHSRGFLAAKEKRGALIVRFEDLKSDPEKHFTRILEQFGLSVSKKRLKKALKLSELSQLQKQEKKSGFRERPEESSSRFFGGPREALSDDQTARIVSLCHREMAEFGYK